MQHHRYEKLPEFTDFLGEWSKRFGLDDVYRPLDPGSAERALAQINARLPTDYLEMMRQTDGFTVGPWHVLGLAEVHAVALGAHTYYHLADDGAFAACVREGSRTGTVYVCPIEDDAPSAEGESLRKLIEESFDEV